MSETPTLPIADPKSDRITQAANHRIERGQAENDFAAWKQEFTRYERSIAVPPRFEAAQPEQWDLSNDEEIDPGVWSQDENASVVETAEPIEEAKPTLTRAQEVEMAFHAYTDEQLRDRFDQITKAIGWFHPAR